MLCFSVAQSGTLLCCRRVLTPHVSNLNRGQMTHGAVEIDCDSRDSLWIDSVSCRDNSHYEGFVWLFVSALSVGMKMGRVGGLWAVDDRRACAV